MNKEPVSKTMKWLLIIFAFALCGFLYFLYLDTNDQLDLASMDGSWMVGVKHKTTRVTVTPTPTTTAQPGNTSTLKIHTKKNTTTGYTLSFNYPMAWTLSSETEQNGILRTIMKGGGVTITVSTPLIPRGLCEGQEVCPYDFPTVVNPNLGTFHLAVAKDKTSYMAPSPTSSDTTEDKTVELDATGTLTAATITDLDAVVKSLNLTK